MNTHSIIGSNDPDRKKYTPLLHKWVKDRKINEEELDLSPAERRGVGSMMGLSIGDALGAST